MWLSLLPAMQLVSALRVPGSRGLARQANRLPPASAEASPGASARVDVLRRGISGDGFVSAKAVDASVAVREMCRVQGCKPLAATALGRAVASTLLIADGLEAEETFQVRFVGDGPLRGVFAVANGALEARGYVGNPALALSPAAGVAPGVGAGQLQVVRLKALPGETDPSPYSSVVAIKSGEIAEDINYFMATSEQREGALSAGVTFDDETGDVDACAGWRVELLPGAPQAVADHVVANVRKVMERGSTTRAVADGASSCDEVLRLLLDGMDPNLDFEDREPTFACTCGVDRVYRTLALLPRDEVAEILDQNDKIEARCEFCCRSYALGPTEIRAHLATLDGAA